jgi:DNA polymerase III epsilon subunit-like protein
MIDYNNYIIYVCDTETTGLDNTCNEVIEVSLLRIYLNFSDDGSIKTSEEQKTWLIKAYNAQSIQDDALKINGHKREDILHQSKAGQESYLEARDVISQIELWMLDDFHSSLDRIFAGQNPMFDIGFLQKLWKDHSTIESFPFAVQNGNRVLDTKQLAILTDVCLAQRREKYNLTSLAKDFGITRRKAHRAEDDTRMTADLLIKFISAMRPSIVQNLTKE